MQDRYAGDIGDFVKYALLRAVAPGRTIGVAWYLHPDEGSAGDGRHVAYLDEVDEWRDLDGALYDALRAIVFRDGRSVRGVQGASLLPHAVFADERLDVSDVPVRDRTSWRRAWFERVRRRLADCSLLFADPDNGLCPDSRFRPMVKRSAKSIPIREVVALSDGRPLIVYHHNTRRKGGHEAEILSWQEALPGAVYAYYWRRWSNRTFFVVNADDHLVSRLHDFAARWARTKGRLIRPPS